MVKRTGQFLVYGRLSGGHFHDKGRTAPWEVGSRLCIGDSPCFGRQEARRHACILRGLLLGEGRKNVERMALRFSTANDGSPAAQKEVVALQEFLTCSPWESGDVMREIQAVFVEEFVSSTSAWPLGTVGVVDETSFEKR